MVGSPSGWLSTRGTFNAMRNSSQNRLLLLHNCHRLTQHGHQNLHGLSNNTSRLQRWRVLYKPFRLAGQELYWAIPQNFCAMPSWLPQLSIQLHRTCWSLTCNPYSMRHSPAGRFPNPEKPLVSPIFKRGDATDPAN